MWKVVLPRDADEGDKRNEESSEDDEGEDEEKRNNPGVHKLRMIQCENLNPNHSTNNLSSRWEGPLPHPKCHLIPLSSNFSPTSKWR